MFKSGDPTSLAEKKQFAPGTYTKINYIFSKNCDDSEIYFNELIENKPYRIHSTPIISMFSSYTTDDYCKKINESLTEAVRKRVNNTDRKIACLLSGGLDSTIIAYLAKKVFNEVIVISCSMLSDADYKSLKNKTNINFSSKIFSNDFRKAYKISKVLGVKFKAVYFPSSNCTKDLKKILRACQDWRDNNVLCEILNLQIAKNLRSYKQYNNEPILTGDFMNEYVADYTSEIINGVQYYPQIKQSNIVRQRFFIKGLDSSDRENLI